MRKVILESPFAGDTNRNIRYARACVRDCITRGDAPIASHLLYTQPGILDDTNPEERKLGIECGLLWGKEAEVTVMYTDLGMSSGMNLGIEQAAAEGRTVEKRSIGFGWEQEENDYEDIFDSIRKEINFQKKSFTTVHDSRHTKPEWLSIILQQLGNAAAYCWNRENEEEFENHVIKAAAVIIATCKSLDLKRKNFRRESLKVGCMIGGKIKKTDI